jgi:hypothetical protein
MGQGNFSRRKVLESGLLLVPAVALAPSLAKAAGACADPADSLRASLHYAEMGPDAKQTCAACGFFEPDASNATACGNCKIFNGPANPKGHCDSWSAKG